MTTVDHRTLEHQADRIEGVLASHKITARVWGGAVLPRFCRYQLTFASATDAPSAPTTNNGILALATALGCLLILAAAAIAIRLPN